MQVDPLHHRCFYVYGLGLSGMAVVGYLEDQMARIIVGDDKINDDVAGHAPQHVDDIDWGVVDVFVPAPGLPETHPAYVRARQEKCEILGELEIYAWKMMLADEAPRIIAVTGTNGKSTTTALIAHLMDSVTEGSIVAGGNLGLPLLKMPMDANWHVVELSSYQLDLQTSFASDVAVLTNLGVDHLDRHGSVEAYHGAKKKLFDQTCDHGGRLVLGVDDAVGLGWYQEFSGRTPRAKSVGLGEDAQIHVADGQLHVDGVTYPLDIPKSLQGRHNGENIASAIGACLAAGNELDELLSALASFPGLPHRLEHILRKGELEFVNDSKATNASSTCHALRAWPGSYWLVGGLSKPEDLSILAKTAKETSAKAFAFGKDAGVFVDALSDFVPVTQCPDLEKAFHAAVAQAQKGDGGTILLSPASASFDAYPNFMARGEHFRGLVEAWGA